MKPDVVVVGAGLAGMTAAARLAESGAKVLVVATGSGAISLAPATIDVMGYVDGARVPDPLAAAAEAPAGHPYAAIGADAVAESLDWLCDAVLRGPLDGYEYWGRGTENLLLPTAVGAVRPTALAPTSVAAGDLRECSRILVAGIDGMKDFHPALIAANLNRSEFGISARAVTVRRPHGLILEPTSMNLARFLDDTANAAELGTELRKLVREDETIALPAVLGLRRPGAALDIVQRETRSTVFEIPTLPPSVPGMRLLDILRTHLRSGGGQVVLHGKVNGAETDGNRIVALEAHVSGRKRRYEAPQFVLATGGLTSGAIALGADWRVRETALGLAVAGAPEPGSRRFAEEYFESHPISKAGVAVDDRLRPLDGDRIVFENLRVAGATIAGAEAWLEKSGDGISLSSGFKAAGLVAAALGLDRVETTA